MQKWMRGLFIIGIGLFLIGGSNTASASTGGDKEIILKGISSSSDGRGWMGIYVQDLTSGLAEALEIDGDGVLVSDVGDTSPADEAGLKPQDVILSINGEPVRDADELMDTMSETEPGEKIHLTIVRDGKEIELDVTLSEQPEINEEVYIHRYDDGSDDLDWRILQRFPPGLGFLKGFSSKPKARLGVTILEPDEELASYFGISEGQGVLITEVMENTPAEKAGLRSGDVILSVNGRNVATTKSLQKALEDTGSDEVELSIMRKGKEMKVTAHIEDSDSPHVIHKRFDHPSGKSKKFEWHSYKGDLQKQMHKMKEQLEELKEEMKELQEDLQGIRE